MPRLNGGGGKKIFSPTKDIVQEKEIVQVKVSIFCKKKTYFTDFLRNTLFGQRKII